MKNKLQFLFLLLLAFQAHGTSIIFPTYSTPILAHGRIIVLSPDRLHVFGVSLSGQIEWDAKLESEGSLYKHKSGGILLNRGSTVSILDSETGAIQALFEAPLDVKRISYKEDSDVFLGYPSWETPKIFVFDGDTYLLKATEELAETVPYSDSEIVVVAKADRITTEEGYTFSKAWIEAFERSTWRLIWTAPFIERKDPYHQMCRVGSYIVWEDGPKLVAARISDGQLYTAPAFKPKDALGPTGLLADGDALLYLASEFNHEDFNKSKQSIYKVTVPEFSVIKVREVEVIEAALLEQAGQFLISDALYRTACFRRDGSKVWEHFQMNRTKVHEGVIYFSYYDEGFARLCSIEVATGLKRILMSEEIKK